ncbi:MAG TPA: FtsX-like permease family protein [Chiayiivirga sp.]|nr:FtsX-like permease family protein [Chiayiivirga sp.]
MIGLRMAWRLLRRDLASGEVRVLLAALALAVMAVTAVAFVTERAEKALALEANRLLGGDVVLRADQPIDAAARELAERLDLQQTETWSFPSMLRAGDALKLSEVRALGEGFPLRGHYRLRDASGEHDATAIPAPGTVWLSRSGAELLGLELDDRVTLGRSELSISALVLQEPDAAMDYFNVAPRVFLRLDDVAATGLVQEGSRVAYRLIVAGVDGRAQGFVDAMQGRLARGQRLETMADARPEVRRALDQGDRFLGLAALVAVILASIAVAMAARRHSARHLDACAVLRCLGASQARIVAIHVGELVLLGLFGSALGVLGGWMVQALLGHWLGQWLGIALPASGVMPVLQGLGVGFVVLLAFAAPPVLSLRRVPALRVLRRDLGAVEPAAAWAVLAGVCGVGALLWWRAGSPVLALSVLAGFVISFAILAVLAVGLITALQAVRPRLRGPWRYGLANVSRRRGSSIAQIASLGLGLMAILLLTLVRTDLIGRWQQSIPTDAPNRFIINVQPDQLDGVGQVLRRHGQAEPELFAMIRARLVSVNGVQVSGDTYATQGERARHLAEREFNLSQAATLRASDNHVVAGTFWAEDDTTPQFSVEEGMARTFGWKLGDIIGFDIAGSHFEAPITSLRRVEWESFRPNFFVVAPAGTLTRHSASYIGAARVMAGDTGLTRDLVAAYPNVSVIDIDQVIAQVRGTADQVSRAVEVVFYFTLLAGVLVLLASISASQDERRMEGSVMRVLGARSRQLRLAHASEFIAIGLIAGWVAAIGAGVVSGLIAVQVFEQAWRPDWKLAALGGGLGVLIVALTGLAATRRIARTPPMQSLRALDG